MRSWKYYRNLLAYWVTLILLLAAAAQALRQPVFWLAVALLWMLHQPVRRAFSFAHPWRRPSIHEEGLWDFREVHFQSRDGLRLSGFFFPSHNRGTLILAHGLGSSGRDLTLLARMLVEEGFGVLLLDLRAHGASQGDTSTYGWKEGEDLVCAVEFLLKRLDVHGGKIGAYGFSLGAQSVLRAALLTDKIRALVLEGPGPVRLSDHGGSPRSLRRWISLPSNWLHYLVYDWMVGGSQPGVLEVIGKVAPRPLLLIGSGPNDLYFNRLFFAAAQEPKELWESPAASHGGALAHDPEEYMRRIVDFFDHALEIERGEKWQAKSHITSTT